MSYWISEERLKELEKALNTLELMVHDLRAKLTAHKTQKRKELERKEREDPHADLGYPERS